MSIRFPVLIGKVQRFQRRWLTAGVTGKGGSWRRRPPGAESAVGAESLASVGERPHLSGARGVCDLFARNFPKG